jgi:hypothetical protein
MWKLWLALGAVGVAVLVTVILVGSRLADPEAAAPPVVREMTWADRATALCRTSLETVRATLASPRGGETDAERSLRLYVATTVIEGRLVSSLRALPAAASDRADVDDALGRLEAQYDKDVFVGNLLQQRFDATLLRQAVAAYEREATRLRPLFARLGAAGCVRYLDPASYG